MRRKEAERVPGCLGLGNSGKAYCYDVRDIPTNSKSIPPLTSFENKCKPGSQCEVCQGTCYESGACKDGLNCVILDKGESLPGCGGIGFPGKGYCYDIAWDRKALIPQTEEAEHECKGDGGTCPKCCPECEGKCTADATDLKDDNCLGALLCFTGSSEDVVPGCDNSFLKPQNVHYCYDPQKQLDNAIVQWETFTDGLSSYKMIYRKGSLVEGYLSEGSECEKLNFKVNYDYTTNPPTKTMDNLSTAPGVQVTPDQCKQADNWDDTFKKMVTDFRSVPEWFEFIQEHIDDLKKDGKKGWRTFNVEYNYVYGYPVKIQFMSGSLPGDEMGDSSSSSTSFRHEDYEFKQFRPRFDGFP